MVRFSDLKVLEQETEGIEGNGDQGMGQHSGATPNGVEDDYVTRNLPEKDIW